MSAPTVPPDSNFKERPESEKILDKGFVGLTTAFAIAIGLILLLIALVIFIPELPPYIYTIIAENPYPSMDTPLNFS